MEITIGEGCFGPILRIDSFNVSTDHFPYEVKESELLYNSFIEALSKCKNDLDLGNWHRLFEVLTSISKFSVAGEYDEGDTCEQCGNWNFLNTYKLD